MKLTIQHLTQYDYSAPVQYALQSLCLTPQLYLRVTPLTEADDRLHAFGRVHLAEGVNEDSAMALARAVLNRIRYQSGATTVQTTALQAWALAGGVCQDHAHVFIAACRASGVPARYVSGYFYAPDAPHLASHAWVDICVEPQSHRWLSIDVTHGCLMDERHVRLAVGLDYSTCSPIRGVREGGGDESMRVRIDIREATTQRIS